MVIRVPSEMVVLSPRGKPRMKQTLTALGNLSRFHKQASIQLIPVKMPEAKIAFDLANQPEAKKEYQASQAKKEHNALRGSPAPIIKYGNAELKIPIDALLRTFQDDAIEMTVPAIVDEIGKTINLKGQLGLVRKLVADYRKNYIKPIATSYQEVKEETEQRDDKPEPKPKPKAKALKKPEMAEPKEPKALKKPEIAEPKEPEKPEPFSVEEMDVKITWAGGKTYIMEYFIGDKKIEAIEYKDTTNPREEAEKQISTWYRKTKIQDKYGLTGLKRLKINMI